MAYHEPRQYDVRLPCGRVLRRNRRFLCPDIALGDPSKDAPRTHHHFDVLGAYLTYKIVDAESVQDFAMNLMGGGKCRNNT
ncbi:hypothetical protein E2C01_036568 [Portunus trituberculatus]|uniref:Uncharacterized protein n=1 Tax=Portunus trituberculatus TaxID=210409 RepID=A0A5B7FEN7_PORTR|nr:hypothetical protein [Portunus trituberculatus]